MAAADAIAGAVACSAQRAAVVSECVDRLPAHQAATLVEALPALEAFAEELQRVAR